MKEKEAAETPPNWATAPAPAAELQQAGPAPAPQAPGGELPSRPRRVQAGPIPPRG